MKCNLTAAQPFEALADTINRLSQRYGKLWPLQTFNACNPLLAYENISFGSALALAEQDLDFSVERSLDVFKQLYNRRVFTRNDLDFVLSNVPGSVLNQRITLVSEEKTYREILLREIEEEFAQTTIASSSSYWASDEAKKLNARLVAYFQDQQPSNVPEANGNKMGWINEQMTKWLAAYLDDGQAIWEMPYKDLSFKQAWSKLILQDSQLSKGVKKNLEAFLERYLKSDMSSLESMASLLAKMNLDSGQQEALLNRHMKQMPGWISYINYCQSVQPSRKDLLSDYLLIRILYDFSEHEPKKESQEIQINSIVIEWRHRLLTLFNSSLFNGLSFEAFAQYSLDHFNQWADYFKVCSPVQKLVWLMEALEHSQNEPLTSMVTEGFLQNALQPCSIKSEPDAQAVFCIDVRSEPLRKVLETTGNIETYGFAGFFGLPISKLAYSAEEAVSLCPILLDSKYTIKEAPSPFHRANVISKLLRQGIPIREQWIFALKKIKRDTFATFSYVESFGFFHAITFFKDSFTGLPFATLNKKLINIISPLRGLIPKLDLESNEQQPFQTGIALPEQVELSKAILKLIGLRQPFAEFVILCGHASQTYNNPYGSSLDCGACGANGGGFNALVLCQMLNHPGIRDALSLEGLNIPEHTRFIAAEHNTTTDEIIFLNPEVIPSQQQQRFMSIQTSFEEAGAINRLNRQVALQPHGSVSYPNSRLAASYDWSQTRPEWGLSKNQAFIIGKRDAIKSLNLEGRCFLHSYDWLQDSDGDILSVIMSAPMVVGAWINLQYLFSTLDQQRFGSGKKYIHNVVGLFGSYLGNASDLQLGLPYESLFANDGFPYHYPQRLLVYIQAPLTRVNVIIESHQNVKNLVQNQWIKLTVFDPEEKITYQFCDSGWQSTHIAMTGC
jgi:uncharacterized protein YbcC (UPF0753/DUF2309 family)